jgi:hypothetical protein
VATLKVKVDDDVLHYVLAYLNEGRVWLDFDAYEELTAANRAELKAFADDWIAAGGDFEEFQSVSLLRRRRVPGYGAKMFWEGGPRTGAVPTVWASSKRSEAHGLFTEFLFHPGRGRLGGPCPRTYKDGTMCGRYFLKKTAQFRKVYCSRQCAVAVVAVPAMERGRAEKQQAILAAVAKKTIDWQKLTRRNRLPWRQWLVKRAELDVTDRQVALWVNKGLFVPPIE